MKDLILLKIGGSICTEKSKGKFKVKNKTLARIAKEIKEAKEQRGFRLILVNGAGPFGHVNVASYDINSGLSTPRDYEGFVKTVCDCSYLNHAVSEAMRREGILAYPYPSSSVIMQSKKRISFFSLDVAKRLWVYNQDIVPVMNGTMVPDAALKGSVLSGDAVIEYLAERLNARLVIFATDVDGIFTADPRKNRKAKLVAEITKESFPSLKRGISGSSSTDVTGGMLGKVERLLGLEAKTLVINGNKPGRIRDALLLKKVRGTVIKP